MMSSLSSVSVDLDDFPLPPGVRADGAVLIYAAEGNGWAGKDKRTTVERFIMMYGNV
jgi:hypothetical protein